jgi:hypothetical protein
MKIGDLGIGIDLIEDPNPPNPPFFITKSVCGPGFIDFSQDTAFGQAVDCTYTPDFGPTAGEPQAAQCLFDNLACRCNKIPVDEATGQVAACIDGERRTSVATCPTPSLVSVPPVPDQSCTGSNCIILPGENAAGCTGSLTVLDLNGNTIRGPNGSDGDTIQIGDGIAELNNDGKCQQVFRAADGFAKLVASTITQECSTPDVASDPIVEYAARSTDNFDSAANAFAVGTATCNPLDGYPPGSCDNDSGANVTFSAQAMFGRDDFLAGECSANKFRCGQELDLTSGDLTFGPPPSKCTLDKKTKLCTCRCARCTPDGTLVNPGVGNQGLFLLTSANSDDAVSCTVRVTGN